MENYTGEVMNSYREAQAYAAAECQAERERLIAQGYEWYQVSIKCRDGAIVPVEVLALTTEGARDEAAELGEVVGEPLTVAQAEAM